MAHQVPFNEDTYRPLAIKGNADSDRPVEFDLSQVGDTDQARVKSLITAFDELNFSKQWNADIQKRVVACLREGRQVFVNGIDAIRNLTVPYKLAVKAGLAAPGDERKAPVAITNGHEFAAIAAYQQVLAIEIAMQIGKLCKEGDIDPRFFGLPAGLSTTPTNPNGSAPPVPKGRGKRATAVNATARAH